MQIPLLHQQILLATERLRDLHRSLMTHSSPVPSAEMENLLQEIRNLYSLALQLNNENSLQLLNEMQFAAAKQVSQVSASVIQPSDEVLATIKMEEVKIKTPENKIAEFIKSSANGESKVDERKHLSSDLHEMFHDSPTVANRFADHKTVAEKISSTENKRSVSDNLKSSVKDIKSAIGLNEKFQFINHLFKGDAKKYHSVIDELNSSQSAEIAMKYVRDISDSNNWESHPESARSFIEIVERRFSL